MAQLDAKAQPPLIQAVLKGDLARVKKLLAAGADPNTTATDRRSALELADRKRDIQLALVDAGANLRRAAKGHMNPVWAVDTGRADVLQKVIDAGGDLNCHTYAGTPIQCAARAGHADMVRLLIELGADLNAGTSIGNPLTDAIDEGHVECAVLLLRAGAKPDTGNEHDARTLLVLATHKRQPAVVEALLAAGAAPDARGKITELDEETYEPREPYGTATPLMIAARLGEARVVDALLKAGANPTLRDEDGNRPLDLALRNGHTEVAARIRKALKAFPETADPNEELLLASERGDAAKVRSLLSAGGCDANARDTRSRSKNATPLLLAVRGGHADVVRALLDAGADASLTDAGDERDIAFARRMFREVDEDTLGEMGGVLGRPALGEAAARGDDAVVELLLTRGAAAVDQPDVVGVTALMRAARDGHAAVVRRLLAAGADVNAKDADKDTAVVAAVRAGSAACVQMLLDAGAKLPSGKKHNLLGRAAGRGHGELVDLLLRQGAKVDAADSCGETALMSAAEGGHADVIRRLLAAGANVNHRSDFGETPLMSATKLGVSAGEWEALRDRNDPLLRQRIEVCRVLIDAGADLNAVNDNGFSALALAVVTYNDPLARFLLERGADPHVRKVFGDTLANMARRHKSPADLVKRLEKPAVAPASAASAARAPRPAKAAPRPKPPAKKKAKPEPEAESEEDPAAPDFSAALDRKDYQRLVAGIEKQCGTKRLEFEDAPGAFHFHVDSRSKFDFDRARKDAAAAGCTLLWLDTLDKQQVGLFPTADPLEALLALGTNGANYDLGPGDVVAWLRALHAEQPFEITAANFDTVEGKFLGDVTNPKQLARRMYKFCPDLVDQGVGSVAALAKSLQESRQLYFWWD